MTVKNSWFEREMVSETAARIWEPFVHPFFRANIFHLKCRDADLVVDFGMGLRSLRDFLAIDPAKPVIAVATHVHVDHVGSFHEFDYRLGHIGESEAFADMGDDRTLAGYFRTQNEAVSRAPTLRWQQKDYSITPASLTEALVDGTRVELGDRSFTVLHLPGHSPGSIGLLDESDGTFFSGDAIYEGNLVDDLPGCDKQDYRRTMRRLLELDVAAVHGGHGFPMTGERMRAIARKYLAHPTSDI